MKTFLNIIWHFPLLGFLMSLGYAISGLLWCITIVGIPIGLGQLQLSRFYLSPFTSALVSESDLGVLSEDESDKSQLMKSLFTIVKICYIPLGAIAALFSAIHILGCFVSLIGIPCGVAEVKAFSTIFSPVGKKCVPLALAEEIQRRKDQTIVNRYIRR